jgi:hypothetical protein
MPQMRRDASLHLLVQLRRVRGVPQPAAARDDPQVDEEGEAVKRHFVKLDSAMLESSLWPHMEARALFITALLMAEPYELKAPMESLEIGSVNGTGWLVPAGWYGMVFASAPGLVMRSGLSLEAGTAALRLLTGPDADSRTPAYDGRRLARVSGGFVVLNYMVYRERDYGAAERQRRYRARVRPGETVTPNMRNEEPSERNVTPNVTHVEVEVEVEVEAEQPPKRKRRASVLAKRPEDVDEKVWADFDALRQARRAPLTETVVTGIRKHAQAASLTLQEALQECVCRGWQSFRADWWAREQRPSSGPRNPGPLFQKGMYGDEQVQRI